MTVSQENYKQSYGEIFHCSKADKEEKRPIFFCTALNFIISFLQKQKAHFKVEQQPLFT